MALSLYLRRALPLTLKSFPKTQTLADPNLWKDGLGGIISNSSLGKRYYPTPPCRPPPTLKPPKYSLPPELIAFEHGSDNDNDDDDYYHPNDVDDNNNNKRFKRTRRPGKMPRSFSWSHYHGNYSRVPGCNLKILVFKDNPFQYSMMEAFAALALKEYTRKTDDIYELVDVDKVNYYMTIHYITFEAKSQKESKTFQAEVDALRDNVVKINNVRIKKHGSKWSDGFYDVPSLLELRAGWCSIP